MARPEVSAASSSTMSEKQHSEEVHGISTAVENTPHVIAGYGETAKKPGAKTKEVHNVSIGDTVLCSQGFGSDRE